MHKEVIARIVKTARAEGRTQLFETEGMQILEAIGVRTPARVFGKTVEEALAALQSSPLKSHGCVVVKVVSDEIPHKSDVGGVKVVSKGPSLASLSDAVQAVLSEMDGALRRRFSISGYTINECVSFEAGLAGELLLGLRSTIDFGPVLTLSPGGLHAEFLANTMKEGVATTVFSVEDFDRAVVRRALARMALPKLFCERYRGAAPRTSYDALGAILEKLAQFGREFMPSQISDFEINPIVVAEEGFVALDALVKLQKPNLALDVALKARQLRPLSKIKNLLEPRSVAIIGVSEKMNPGHVILNNLIRDGFDRYRIYIVKPGSDTIEGCRCVPDIGALPETVDLMVVGVSAAQVPEVVLSVVEQKKAESLIVIPGGLEEKKGADAVVEKMRAALGKSRQTAWRGPLINGGNCLGVRSVPGKYDTMFIPEYKLGVPKGRVAPIALVSQSGAFAIARMSNLAGLNPKFAITIGNQSDLTIGDYLEYLERDESLLLYAVYVEGFRPLDGAKFLSAARRITRRGASVILYRAGRTAAGAQASASHTASIAGDYRVTRELCEQAGVVFAESLEEFDGLIRLFHAFGGRKLSGRRLGAVSNAGFECVAIGDGVSSLRLAEFDERTVGRLSQIFAQGRIRDIVDVHNPLDLTPMAGDELYEHVVRTVLADSNVDAAVVACIPLTPALNTLARSSNREHGEDTDKVDSLANRLVRLFHDSGERGKPWVTVVDSGERYDRMARILEEGGVPVFRKADQATRLIEKFIASHSEKLEQVRPGPSM